MPSAHRARLNCLGLPSARHSTTCNNSRVKPFARSSQAWSLTTMPEMNASMAEPLNPKAWNTITAKLLVPAPGPAELLGLAFCQALYHLQQQQGQAPGFWPEAVKLAQSQPCLAFRVTGLGY